MQIWAITQTQGSYSDVSYELLDQYYLSEEKAEDAVRTLEREGAIFSLRMEKKCNLLTSFPRPVYVACLKEQGEAAARFAPNTANRRISIRNAENTILEKYTERLRAESKARDEWVEEQMKDVQFSEEEIQQRMNASDVHYGVQCLTPAE